MENIRRKDGTQVSEPSETCVRADKDKCLSRQTLVSDNPSASPCRADAQEPKHCARCRRELPPGQFYQTGNGPDSYCKECRKDVNRLNRKLRAYRPEAEETPPRYPVITDVREREVRMQLILNALYTVRESVMRKDRKRREDEFLQDDEP